MRAGQLDKRVTIQRKTVTKDTYGAEVIVWEDVCTVWAQVSPLVGREYLGGKQLEEEQNARIRMRYRDGINPAMRATWDDHIYDIIDAQQVNTDGRELVLMCRELLDTVPAEADQEA